MTWRWIYAACFISTIPSLFRLFSYFAGCFYALVLMVSLMSCVKSHILAFVTSSSGALSILHIALYTNAHASNGSSACILRAAILLVSCPTEGAKPDESLKMYVFKASEISWYEYSSSIIVHMSTRSFKSCGCQFGYVAIITLTIVFVSSLVIYYPNPPFLPELAFSCSLANPKQCLYTRYS